MQWYITSRDLAEYDKSKAELEGAQNPALGRSLYWSGVTSGPEPLDPDGVCFGLPIKTEQGDRYVFATVTITDPDLIGRISAELRSRMISGDEIGSSRPLG
jgi:hypothetical protein